MKKRLLAMLMASAMCLSLLAGCGGETDAPAGNEPSGDAPAAGDTAVPESDKVYRHGFVLLPILKSRRQTWKPCSQRALTRCS